MARHISQVIEEMPPIRLSIPSDISEAHDIEITQHGFGLDIAQNGLVVHVDHGQFEVLRQLLGEVK